MGSRVSSFYNNIKSWTVKQLIICGTMRADGWCTAWHQTPPNWTIIFEASVNYRDREIVASLVVGRRRRSSVRSYLTRVWVSGVRSRANAISIYTLAHPSRVLNLGDLWRQLKKQTTSDWNGSGKLIYTLGMSAVGKKRKKARRKKLWYTSNTSVKYSTSFFFTTTTIRLLVHHSNEQDDWNAATFL